MKFASSYIILLLLVIGNSVMADSFQSYEAGTYPIRQRIEVLKKTITVIESRLDTPNLSLEEKELRLSCLQQYFSEKAVLEEDLDQAKILHQLPFVTFLAAKTEDECMKGLAL